MKYFKFLKLNGIQILFGIQALALFSNLKPAYADCASVLANYLNYETGKLSSVEQTGHDIVSEQEQMRLEKFLTLQTEYRDTKSKIEYIDGKIKNPKPEYNSYKVMEGFSKEGELQILHYSLAKKLKPLRGHIRDFTASACITSILIKGLAPNLRKLHNLTRTDLPQDLRPLLTTDEDSYFDRTRKNPNTLTQLWRLNIAIISIAPGKIGPEGLIAIATTADSKPSSQGMNPGARKLRYQELPNSKSADSLQSDSAH